MAYYYDLNYLVDNIIFERMLRNQNICKLLECFSECDNDWDYDPFSEPDIENTMSLFMTKIFPLPKDPEAVLEQKGLVTITLSGGESVKTNLEYRYVYVNFDIIFNLSEWKIRDGYRPYYMMYEITKFMSEEVSDLPIVGSPYLVGFQARQYNNYFYGVQLRYRVSVSTDVDCSPLPRSNIDFRLQGKQYGS